MEKIDLVNIFVKMFLISFSMYLTYGKITNDKSQKISYIIAVLVSAIISIIYVRNLSALTK